MQQEYILSLRDISRTYPGVKALDHVSVDFIQGEVHALVGENGAGKSTLIKMITGADRPDSGEIIWNGKTLDAVTPKNARDLGIEAIYQEFNLVPSLSVAENIFLGKRLMNGRLVDHKLLVQKAGEILDYMHVKLDPRTKVKDLTVAYMQMVEIAKAVSKNAKLLIMDEPTAPLTSAEVDVLFSIVRQLKQEGVTIIYISHRLEELFEISDRLTVMRDGQKIITADTASMTRPQLIKYMVGRDVSETVPVRNKQPSNETVFEARRVVGGPVKDISFQVHRGEVLGIAGLVGAGRTELVRMLFGADKMDSGELYYEGAPVRIRSPHEAIESGFALVPEDRKNQGAILNMTIADNITLPVLRRISKTLVVDDKKAASITEEYGKALTIKTPSMKQLVKNLSGGNQQKVVLAKWLASGCKLLMLDEPTRGIDVGAKQEIYNLINHLAESGIAIILISSEIDEMMGLSDRLIVLSEGRYMGQLQKEQFTQERILQLASGIQEGAIQ